MPLDSRSHIIVTQVHIFDVFLKTCQIIFGFLFYEFATVFSSCHYKKRQYIKNVSKTFLNLITKYFPAGHTLHKIINGRHAHKGHLGNMTSIFKLRS